MRMTLERAIPPDTIAELYELYAAAFRPMQTRAAARHLLTRDEFTAEMVDERIEKYLVRNGGGEPLGLTTMTRHLSAVAWISPEFCAARYPEYAARDALYYLGYTLVRPGLVSFKVFTLMLDEVVRRLRAERAVCVFDVSAFNDRRSVGRFVSAVPRGHGARLEAVDVQTYYGLGFADADGADDVDDAAIGVPVSLAERPELADRIPALMAGQWPEFMLAGRPGHGVDLDALLVDTPRHQLALVDPSGELLCVGLSVPLRWDGTDAGLPEGWDGAVRAAAALRQGGGTPDAVCALSITVASGAARSGLATTMIEALRSAAALAGAGALIAPVRPILKARYPLTPMREFAAWRTPDGRPFDPWLRLHLRLGAEAAGIAETSMTITGDLPDWERWTGLALPETGAYVIPGGLAPLRVDRAAGTANYVEPNVWVVHRVDGAPHPPLADGRAERAADHVRDPGGQPADKQLA